MCCVPQTSPLMESRIDRNYSKKQKKYHLNPQCHLRRKICFSTSKPKIWSFISHLHGLSKACFPEKNVVAQHMWLLDFWRTDGRPNDSSSGEFWPWPLAAFRPPASYWGSPPGWGISRTLEPSWGKDNLKVSKVLRYDFEPSIQKKHHCVCVHEYVHMYMVLYMCVVYTQINVYIYIYTYTRGMIWQIITIPQVSWISNLRTS